MLLTISTTHQPATDLGFLLAKHPDRVRTVELGFGDAHVVFPEATDERCTAALLVEVDPVGLVRRKGRDRESFSLAGYVNDRPYAASSFLSVALSKVFRSAMNGRCEQRPELAATAIPLVVELPTVPCRGGAAVLRELFEPLGYEVQATPIALDQQFPEWGDSRYLAVRLTGTVRLADLLTHLYVLLPVLDDEKHYWVGDDEARKLLDKGGDWLAAHPARDLITRRYLKHRRALAAGVLAQLAEDDPAEPGAADEQLDQEEAAVEQPISLNQRRLDTVVATLRELGAARILDLGCGEGRLVQALLRDPAVGHVTGVDVSTRVLERAESRLHLDRLGERQAERVTLLHGGLTYRDQRFGGFDAACLVEVVEHLDEDRLGALEQVVFAHARPTHVVVTTPNVEHNVRFEGLPAGKLRHRDHRFEWTRAEFAAWAERVAAATGYTVRFAPIGDDDPEVGPPTQMAVFSRRAEARPTAGRTAAEADRSATVEVGASTAAADTRTDVGRSATVEPGGSIAAAGVRTGAESGASAAAGTVPPATDAGRSGTVEVELSTAAAGVRTGAERGASAVAGTVPSTTFRAVDAPGPRPSTIGRPATDHPPSAHLSAAPKGASR